VPDAERRRPSDDFMTNPRGIPRFGTWTAPECPFSIEYSLDTLDRIRLQITGGLEALTRGAPEVGGLLLGAYDGDNGCLVITEFEPLDCEHAFGPRFILSEKDRDALARRLLAHGNAARSGYKVVGWYRSHTRHDLVFSPEDVAVYDAHFTEPWQVSLLLQPDTNGNIQTFFFFREQSPAAQAPAPDKPIPEQDSGTSEPESRAQLAVRGQAANVLEPTRGALSQRRGTGTQDRMVWVALASICVVSVAAILYLRSHFFRGNHLLGIEVANRRGNLELTWDPLDAARRGRLEIQAGPISDQVELDRKALSSGRFRYRRQSDVTAFRLHVERTDGTVIEESVTYVVPGSQPPPAEPWPPAAAPPAVAPSGSVADPGSAGHPAAPLSPQPARPENRTPPAPAVPSQAQDRHPTPQPVATADRVKPNEPVNPQPQPAPATEPVQVAQTRQSIPEVPAVAPSSPPPVQPPPATNPVQQPAPPPAQTTRVTPPPPPAPAPSVQPPRPQLQLSGRWSLQAGGYSRSPAVPESLSVTVTDANGAVQGTLEARYRFRSKTERVNFSFSGRILKGIARFPWVSSDGRRGEIEFIRVPNASDAIEVVWYGSEVKQAFDEMLRRSN